MIQQCAYCGDHFTAKRIDARYCGATCRSAARRKGGAPEKPRRRWVETGDHSVPDSLWPTNNEYGIPVLDLAGQADAIDYPITKWGSVARTARHAGTWHFYTDDPKFAALWRDPAALVRTSAITAVEPNYTIADYTPRAVALWQIYRKRWIARYWQSKGIRVIVDLFVSEHCADLNRLGIPPGWATFATRARADNVEGLEYRAQIAREIAGRDPLLMVIGSSKIIQQVCQARAWLYVESGVADDRR